MTDPIHTQSSVPPPPAAPPPQPVPVLATTDPRRKSPFLAAVLSAMPGLGQVYVGYYQRGFLHILVVATIIALLAAEVLDGLIPLAGLFLAFFWLYNIVDAWRRAALYNQALAGHGVDIELPADFQVPGLQGTIPGGVTLAVVGFILLLNTRFGFSLAWVEQWWPAAFIFFGGYLVWKALRERSGGGAGFDG